MEHLYNVERATMRKKLYYLLWLLWLICPLVSIAQQDNLDLIVNKIIELPAPNQRIAQQLPAPQTYLVKVKPGIRIESLTGKDILILRRLNHQLIVVQTAQQGFSGEWFEKKWPVNYLWKLSDDLLLYGNKESQNQYTIRIASPSVKNTVAAISGLEIMYAKNTILTVKATLETIIDKVLLLDEVLYVGLESNQPLIESPVQDMNLNPNGINRIHHYWPDLNGEGITISIQEQPYHTEDIDLKGRHLPSGLSGEEVSDHATDMATIAGGAGNSFITGKGVAWGAYITSSDYNNLLPDDDTSYTRLNSWVQNHSYGSTIENFYGTRAEAFDASANRNTSLLHIFSAGNNGTATSSSGTYQGIPAFANLTGNFKMAKNILTVGAVSATGQPMAFSSRGPACDGRIKPEVVAYSTAGTSNSTALVSGTVALLQQAYTQQKGTLPDAALLKALLINSARDAGPSGIDFITGFGNIDGYQTLQNLTEQHYFSGKVRQGESKTFTLQVPAMAANLKITMVWNDPAALANANIALVNDLDMQVKNNAGSSWLPWVLDASPDPAKLTETAVRGEDHLNNVEQVTINELSAGTYTITVKGFDVSSGPQLFYIAYQWDTLQQFEWAYPTGSDNMPYNGETDTHFLWKSTLLDTTGRLEYSLDGGITWQLIADDVNLKNGYYRWAVPQITAWAQARMVVGHAVYPTQAFSVSWPLPITVGYNCGDSLFIHWPYSAQVHKYELSVFDDTKLKTVLLTADTAVMLRKSQIASQLFTVQPLLKEGGRGIRAHTYNYASSLSACYMLSFHAEGVQENGIDFFVELGTVYGIDRIVVERKKGTGFEVLSLQVPLSKQIRFTDSQPQQGLNIHRIRVHLSNGKEIVSDVVSSYYLNNPPVMVFPNPVSLDEKLNIFSKEFTGGQVMFSLYDVQGKVVLTAELRSDRESVSLTNVLPGFYLYSVQAANRCSKGKIIVSK